MKLKHLFLSTLVACAFASCSDDDGPGEPVYQQIDSYLSISTTANTGTITKAGNVEDGEPATEVGDKKERKIHTLTAVVFYEDGKLAATKTVEEPSQDENGNTEIKDIIVKVAAIEAGQISTTQLKVYLLANVSLASSDIADYGAFVKAKFSGITNCSFDGVMSEKSEQYIPMSSSELTVEGMIAGTAYNNWMEAGNKNPVLTSNPGNGNDYKKLEKGTDGIYMAGSTSYKVTNRISLVRYVARVQLESLTVAFDNNYDNAEFELTKVSLANVSNYSLYVEQSGSLQPGDMLKDDFYRGFPETIERADYYLGKGQYAANALSKSYEGIALSSKKPSTITFNDQTTQKAEGTHDMAQFYAFEFQSVDVTPDNKEDLPSTANTKINTMLIITGNWKNGPINEERSFRIPIRHSNEDYQVKRNYIYKVHATLTGEGTANPDKNMLNACLSFSIDVQPWKVIKQTEDDVN